MSTLASAVKQVARVPRALWWIFAGALILVLASQAPLSAEECPAVDSLGNPRECTAMEKYGQCLTNGLDSYDQCMDAASSWLGRRACDMAWSVDFWACTAALPLGVFDQLK